MSCPEINRTYFVCIDMHMFTQVCEEKEIAVFNIKGKAVKKIQICV